MIRIRSLNVSGIFMCLVCFVYLKFLQYLLSPLKSDSDFFSVPVLALRWAFGTGDLVVFSGE